MYVVLPTPTRFYFYLGLIVCLGYLVKFTPKVMEHDAQQRGANSVSAIDFAVARLSGYSRSFYVNSYGVSENEIISFSHQRKTANIHTNNAKSSFL